MILDSNIIIHSGRPEYPGLRRLIASQSPVASAISLIEVLGYHKITPREQSHFEAFFAAVVVLPVSEAVIAKAVALRQTRKLSLGDALVAATALVYGKKLLTQNLKDFTGISGLTVSNPLANGDPA